MTREPSRLSLAVSMIATLAPIAGLAWSLVMLVRAFGTLGTTGQLPAWEEAFSALGRALLPIIGGILIALGALAAWHLLQWRKRR